MNIRSALLNDIELLAVFNQGMLLEKHSAELPSLQELKVSIQQAIDRNHKAFLFEVQESIVGYALVDFSPALPTIRHFHISRQHQRKGYGRRAFVALLNAARIFSAEIEICEENPGIVSFWKSLGYTPRIVRQE